MVKIFYVCVSYRAEYRQYYIPKRYYPNDIYSGDAVHGL